MGIFCSKNNNTPQYLYNNRGKYYLNASGQPVYINNNRNNNNNNNNRNNNNNNNRNNNN